MFANDVLKTVRTMGEYKYYSLRALDEANYIDMDKLPYTIKILLESLLREYDGENVTWDHLLNMTKWGKEDFDPSIDLPFVPTRVLLQDFTGVPVIVDFASMRKALADYGGDPNKINPKRQVDLVIDHSLQVDKYGSADSLEYNTKKEYERNQERYKLLNWAQKAFTNLKVVPPSMGIVHQINLEYLADIVTAKNGFLFFDSLVGTDSHTPMVNALGVLGWGVGGIEAEAGMLGVPSYMQAPKVIGVKLSGRLKEGVSATDLALKVTETLRERGVVGAFVEYFGPGIKNLSLADRASVSNMSPEYGATCGFFPVDDETLKYLALTGRSKDHIALVKAYTKENGIFYDPALEPTYTDLIEIDLSDIDISLAGPKRPQDRILLKDMKEEFNKALYSPLGCSGFGLDREKDHNGDRLNRGDLVIAAITSCTNTSNPYVMIGAGLVAKKAYELGLRVKDHVKTSLAPGSKVVTEYLKESGLLFYLEKLGFSLVGYGCTTCIGNSGPLKKEIEEDIIANDLVVAAVLSGNRNFEGRIHPLVKANYLASPPLVVAYALAGTVDFDFYKEPLAKGKNGEDVFFKDIWPSSSEINKLIDSFVRKEQFIDVYENLYEQEPLWKEVDSEKSSLYSFDNDSTYIQNPPFFEDLMTKELRIKKIEGLRVLAYLDDSVTTDHISPAGSFNEETCAGKYLLKKGVDPNFFNSYGSRRGNHKLMMRGTFANVRIRNKIAKGREGGYTTYWPNDELMTIYEASKKYKEDKTSLLVIAGEDYGMGSSRDWAAKGPSLLGVKAVLAKSYERIHRSNLSLMGVLPLQFTRGEDANSLGLIGDEAYLLDLDDDIKPNQIIKVQAKSPRGTITFDAIARFDSVHEIEYYRHGGILQMVLRKELP